MVHLKCQDCGCIFHRNCPIDSNVKFFRYGELVGLSNCPDCNSNNTDPVEHELGVVCTPATDLRLKYMKQKYYKKREE